MEKEYINKKAKINKIGYQDGAEHNYAYIAVLSNEKYLPGIEVLQYSLKQVGAKYPFYDILLTEHQ